MQADRGRRDLVVLRCKQKNVPVKYEDGYGDVWTWTAICADTKLVPAWFVGERTTEDGTVFMRDLSSRLDNRIQLTTDGLASYPIAVESAFYRQIDYVSGRDRVCRPAGLIARPAASPVVLSCLPRCSHRGRRQMGTVMDLSAEDLRARRADLLDRLSMPWDRLVELAEAYALDASERNIYETIRAIDYVLLEGDPDE